MADVDKVLSIEQAVHAYPWTRGNFCDALKSDYLCYVEEMAGELCAYAVLMPGVDEAELLNMAVAKEYQRRGLGSMMLIAMLKMAASRELSRVLLEVRASNLAAMALYCSAGFKQVNVRRGYYRNMKGNEDAIVMACDIPSPLAPLPQVGEVDVSVVGVNSTSLPQAGERSGERDCG